MVVHMNFALIQDAEVKNIIVGDYYNCNELAISTYGNDAFAVEVTQIPVSVGDKFENGFFKRYNIDLHDYEIINPIPTDRQEIDALTEENKALRELITDLQLGLVELAEEL